MTLTRLLPSFGWIPIAAEAGNASGSLSYLRHRARIRSIKLTLKCKEKEIDFNMRLKGKATGTQGCSLGAMGQHRPGTRTFEQPATREPPLILYTLSLEAHLGPSQLNMPLSRC